MGRWAAMSASFELREERPGDADAIATLLDAAFGGPAESELVAALRAGCDRLLSLVAEDDGEIVGFILFSPARASDVEGMGLAPMAVAPDRQRSGIGSALVREGLDRLRAAGCPFVIVLGHAEYYPRFGFEPASRRGLRCQWDVPDEVFRVLVLDDGAMSGVSGVATYRPELGNL